MITFLLFEAKFYVLSLKSLTNLGKNDDPLKDLILDQMPLSYLLMIYINILLLQKMTP